MSKTAKALSWVFRLVITAIFLMVVVSKFTGDEESKQLFTTLMGAESEAIGRIGSGVIELAAVILLFLPKTLVYGAILSLVTMAGAIFSHFTTLGISVNGDGGMLFSMAIIVFVLSAALIYLFRKDLNFFGE